MCASARQADIRRERSSAACEGARRVCASFPRRDPESVHALGTLAGLSPLTGLTIRVLEAHRVATDAGGVVVVVRLVTQNMRGGAGGQAWCSALLRDGEFAWVARGTSSSWPVADLSPRQDRESPMISATCDLPRDRDRRARGLQGPRVVYALSVPRYAVEGGEPRVQASGRPGIRAASLHAVARRLDSKRVRVGSQGDRRGQA